MKQEIPQVIRSIHELFKCRRLTLSAAESCTGGLISHYITSLPGASVFFKAGIVSYSEDAKKIYLGISDEAISRFGLVSKETAKEMAEKVRLLSKTDYAVSATGNLGPGVLEGKEKGLIYIAACREGMALAHELRLTGGREENKEEAVYEALKLLLELAGK